MTPRRADAGAARVGIRTTVPSDACWPSAPRGRSGWRTDAPPPPGGASVLEVSLDPTTRRHRQANVAIYRTVIVRMQHRCELRPASRSSALPAPPKTCLEGCLLQYFAVDFCRENRRTCTRHI